MFLLKHTLSNLHKYTYHTHTTRGKWPESGSTDKYIQLLNNGIFFRSLTSSIRRLLCTFRKALHTRSEIYLYIKTLHFRLIQNRILFSRTAIMFRKPLVKVVKCWEDNDLTDSRRIPSYIVRNIQFYNAEHWVQCT